MPHRHTARPGRRTRTALGLAAAATLLLGSAACAEEVKNLADLNTEDQSQTYQHAVSRIEFDLAAGDVTVSAHDSPGTVEVDRKLQWKSSKPQISEDWSGDTLRITVTCPDDQENCAVHYKIKAPAAVAVQARTGAGNYSLADITGDIDVTADAGDTTVSGGAAGKLRVNSVDGDLTATGLRATDVAAQTKSGQLKLAFDAPPTTVRVTAESGDIEVAVPAAAPGGYAVQANTTDGTSTIDVAQDSAGQHSIIAETTVGDVRIVNS